MTPQVIKRGMVVAGCLGLLALCGAFLQINPMNVQALSTVEINRATGGTVTARGENASAGYGKEKAFDRDVNTKWQDTTNSTWIQYLFPNSNAYQITKYTITSAGDAPTLDPKSWTLQGSNNGSSWTNLDSQSSQTFAGRNLKKTYPFSNSTAYQYYRLNNIKSNGGSQTQIGEIELLETVTVPEPVIGNGTGLVGTYYDNVDFTNPKLVRKDATINFDWGSAAPDSALEATTFSVRWNGEVQPQYTGTYTFYTTADDGIRLWVDGQRLIDDWQDHSATEKSGTISLIAGQKYPIKLEFYENQGVASVKLLWSSNYQTKAVIPPSQLYSETVPPTTTCDYQKDGAWVKNPVTIRLTAQDDNSGVFQSYYKINNGIDTVGNTITISADGIYNIEYWAVDNAGNVEPHHPLMVKIDQTGPGLVATQTPARNANGWNNSDVTVTFTANDVLSGVKTVSSPVTITRTGLNQTVNGTAEDHAGNQSALTYAVSIDKNAPLISNLQPQGTTNNLRPTISAMISDDLAGIDPASVIMKVDGAIVNAVATESGVSYAPPADLTTVNILSP